MQAFLEQMKKIKTDDLPETYLTLVEQRGTTNNKWLWRCVCGTEKLINASLVMARQTKSCGCMLPKNIKKRGNDGYVLRAE